MTATVRLNSELEEILNSIAKRFHQKKSDVIREAIRSYAKELEKSQTSRMQKAIDKTSKKNFEEYKIFEESLNDGL